MQNHATMSDFLWHPDDDSDIRTIRRRSLRRAAERRRAGDLAVCSLCEGAVDHQGVPAEHSSLHGGKGILDCRGLVTEAVELIIPMRDCETGGFSARRRLP